MNRYTIAVEIQVDIEVIDAERIRFLQSRVALMGPTSSNLHNQDGSPTREGIKMGTCIMTLGLSNNLHYAHDKGLWDSAEHLRYIIQDLEEQFVKVPAVSVGSMKPTGRRGL